MGSSESRQPQTPSPAEKMAASTWIDPRSPSQNVQRTPLRLEETNDDPRSPTQNVIRTPIFVSERSKVVNGMRDVRQALNYENEHCKTSSRNEVKEKLPLADRNN